MAMGLTGPNSNNPSFSFEENTSKLTDEQHDSTDKQLAISECFAALKTFKKNKTPGNNGLTVEF